MVSQEGKNPEELFIGKYQRIFLILLHLLKQQGRGPRAKIINEIVLFGMCPLEW